MEVLQARPEVTDPTRVSTALLHPAVAAAGHVKQAGALVLQVVVLVKIQRQHLVHLHKDLPELLGQVQPPQLAQVAAAEHHGESTQIPLLVVVAVVHVTVVVAVQVVF